MNSTNVIISFVIIMLMLSLVSERLSNFLKLHFNDRRIVIPFLYLKEPYKLKTIRFYLKVRLKILSQRQPTRLAEKEREYRILTINILVGVLLSAFVNANFFQLISSISTPNIDSNGKVTEDFVNVIPGWVDVFEDGGKLFGMIILFLILWGLSVLLFSRLREVETKVKDWTIVFNITGAALITLVAIWVFGECRPKEAELPFQKIFNHILGFIITGLFLSLGSKFWHDLLGVLFEIKNTRKVLNSSRTYTEVENAEQLKTLLKTSSSKVTSLLLKKYEKKIKTIDEVISIGFVNVFSSKDNMYRKMIEVEVTSAKGQYKLEDLSENASIEIDYNTFYLWDYLHIVQGEEYHAISSNLEQDIKEKEPVCYAFNIADQENMGSFHIIEEKGKYFAESNLHVFASSKDFSVLADSDDFIANDTTVKFIINDKPFEGVIVDWSFGDDNSKKDYCRCEVDRELFEAYHDLIRSSKMIDQLKVDDEMKMFGARSKEIEFKPIVYNDKNDTWCRINFGHFKREMHLQKITRTSGSTKRGDSGASIYYKTKNYKGEIVIKRGILVSGNQNNSRMFIL